MKEKMEWVIIKERDRYGREYTRKELRPVSESNGEATESELLEHVMQSLMND